MNLASLIDHSALYFKDKIALAYGENKYTYGHLKSATERIAVYLRDQGVRRGNRIAIFMPNRPEWVAVYLESSDSGPWRCAPVPLPKKWKLNTC